ncbi:MAG: hypothetical protein J6D18_04835, partial [Erysipelotrichaceae bacterium]|nr:hypothetical protein [Erysipelotrichaceae bacterium]
AILQMVLTNEDPSIQALLEDNGIINDEKIMITRTITGDNKSTVRINQQITTLSFIKELAGKIIDVHSQMDTFQLMNPFVQMDLLDRYAGTVSLRQEVRKAFEEYHLLVQEKEELVNEKFSDDELDFLTNQYNQIEQAALQEGELEELQEKIKVLSQVDQHIQHLSESIRLMNMESGISDQLYLSFKALEKNDAMQEIADELKEMYYRIDEIKDQLQQTVSTYQNDSESLDLYQSREFEIRSLFKRFGGSYNAVMKKKEQLLKQIDQIIHREDVLKRLDAQIEEKESIYIQKAQSLSKQRCSVFDELSNKVEKECHDLMLEHARFRIRRQEKKYSADGIDAIEFQVSMNPGTDFSSLKESASGGELSRLMLALKVIFQSQSGVQTIIFDEIDTGVSGKVAFSMGQKMHHLSQDYQVLCITHLASVAAAADVHYKVEKESHDENTITGVTCLDEEESLYELANMTSGTQSEINIEAARELKARAHHG